MQSESEMLDIDAKKFNLEEFVKNATWRELLIHLVESNKLDPWDIDISAIVRTYLDLIKKIKIMNLAVPANMILAASILLKLKSNTIPLLEEDALQEQDQEQESIMPRQPPEVAQLVTRFRQQVPRKISLSELLDALEKSMKMEQEKATRISFNNRVIDFPIEKEDIDAKIAELYEVIKAAADSEGMLLFSRLSERYSDPQAMIMNVFVPLLYLAHDMRITLMQEIFFGDIIIKLINDQNAG